MFKLASHLLGLTEEQIGAWIRKAVNDWNNGCTAPDVDPAVKKCYEESIEIMNKKQEIDAQTYRRRLAKLGKIKCADAADREAAENNSNTGNRAKVESGTSAQPFATTSCHTINADNSNEDGDTREDSQDRKSATSSLQLFKTDAVSTPCKTLAGATPKESCGLDSPVSLSGKAPASTASEKKPYGTCGHVMLTDAEGHHLREVYGENLRIAIDILDAYIENNGKAAKKYKNHAAVMRKGNWVWEKVQKMILDEKRIDNASRRPTNWKAEERERTARVLRGESPDGKNIVRDEDLTPKEFMAKYG